MLTFSVAGSPLSTAAPGGTIAGLRRSAALGIHGMEIEWVRNVPREPAHMAEIRATAEKLGVTLTAHAPYYVNLNSPNRAIVQSSCVRIQNALAMAELAGIRSVCVHAAFNMGKPPAVVHANVARSVDAIMQRKGKLFPHVNLALETMGKPAQFGTLEEVLTISKEFDLYPCVDFAHLHAREQGKINTSAEWDALLDQYEDALGKGSLQNMHLHYSGILYGPHGERKHLPLQESDAHWKELLGVLKKRKVGGVLVCESPDIEGDTVLLQQAFEKLKMEN